MTTRRLPPADSHRRLHALGGLINREEPPSDSGDSSDDDSGPPTRWKYLKIVERYLAGENRWITLASMRADGRFIGASVVDGCLWAVTRVERAIVLDKYDPSVDAWVEKHAVSRDLPRLMAQRYRSGWHVTTTVWPSLRLTREHGQVAHVPPRTKGACVHARRLQACAGTIVMPLPNKTTSDRDRAKGSELQNRRISAPQETSLPAARQERSDVFQRD